MQAKHLIIPQQINPFGAILKGMRITGKKKKRKKRAVSFRSARCCSKYQVLFALLIQVTCFNLTFTLLHIPYCIGNGLHSFSTMLFGNA